MQTSRVPLASVALVWIVMAAILIVRAFPAIGALKLPDPDDMLRLVQVRDLLGGQGWFDLHQYRIDGPEGTLMHWSRLVDAPLALVIALLTPLLGGSGAEQAAVVIVPMLILGAILLAVATVAARFTSRAGVMLACICLGLTPLLTVQVQPLRIDHHGWQIFTIALALVGMLPVTKPWASPLWRKIFCGPSLSGIALALGITISLEILPIAAAFGAVFTLRWLANDAMRGHLPVFLTSLCGTLILAFAVTRGVADVAEHCDAISPAHLAAFVLMALGATLVARLAPRPRLVLIGLLALPVVGAAIVYLWVAPQCAAGPFGNLDPLVRELWYEQVAEGRPAWRVATILWIPALLQALLALAVLGWLCRTRMGEERRWWSEYLVILAAALVTGLLVWRSMAFVGVLSAVPLGLLAAGLFKSFETARRVPAKLACALGLVIVLVPTIPVATVLAMLPAQGTEAPEDSTPASSACSLEESAAALGKLPRGKIFAPLDLGAPLLLRSHHGIVASAHHRAAQAMHDVIAAFTGTPEMAREMVRRHDSDYVVLCLDAGEVRLYRKHAPGDFADMLAKGQVPAWLEPVTLDAPDAVRLWKVDKVALAKAG